MLDTYAAKTLLKKFYALFSFFFKFFKHVNFKELLIYFTFFRKKRYMRSSLIAQNSLSCQIRDALNEVILQQTFSLPRLFICMDFVLASMHNLYLENNPNRYFCNNGNLLTFAVSRKAHLAFAEHKLMYVHRILKPIDQQLINREITAKQAVKLAKKMIIKQAILGIKSHFKALQDI